MADVFVMPKLGLTMDEGVLAAWMVGLGDSIEVGQDLCEIETEKLTTVVESPFRGTLLRRVEPGDTIPVGQPIAVIGKTEEDVSSYPLYSGGAVTASNSEHGSKEFTAAAPSDAYSSDEIDIPGKVTASPLARKLAARLGVDLSTVVGTGPAGRITGEDVEQASLAQGGADGSTAASPSG